MVCGSLVVVKTIQWCESSENLGQKMDINQMIKSYLRIRLHIYGYLKAAAACIVLCMSIHGCDQESDPFVPEEPEQVPISMNATSVAKIETSRALIEGDTHLQNAGFVMHGHVTKLDGTNRVQVFNDQKVEYDKNNSIWDYTPKRYWLRDVHYYFGTYAPACLSRIARIDVKSDEYTLKFTMPNWQVVDDDAEDLIVATSNGSAANYVSQHKGVVNLQFEHVLSCLEVRLKKESDSGNSYSLKGLTYSNVPTSGGETICTLDYGPSGNRQMSAPNLGDMTVCSGADFAVGTGAQGSPAVTFSHLVAPFTVPESGKVTMSINYVAGNSFEYTREITTDLTGMLAGKKYILTLTFAGGGNIIPELELAEWKIEKWNDQDIEDDPKYNW